MITDTGGGGEGGEDLQHLHHKKSNPPRPHNLPFFRNIFSVTGFNILMASFIKFKCCLLYALREGLKMRFTSYKFSFLYAN